MQAVERQVGTGGWQKEIIPGVCVFVFLLSQQIIEIPSEFYQPSPPKQSTPSQERNGEMWVHILQNGPVESFSDCPLLGGIEAALVEVGGF